MLRVVLEIAWEASSSWVIREEGTRRRTCVRVGITHLVRRERASLGWDVMMGVIAWRERKKGFRIAELWEVTKLERPRGAPRVFRPSVRWKPRSSSAGMVEGERYLFLPVTGAAKVRP
jgi:hypothetical protein